MASSWIIRAFGERFEILHCRLRLDRLGKRGDLFEVGVLLRLRHEVHHHEMHGLAVGRAVVDPLRAPTHRADHVPIVPRAGVRARPAQPNAGVVGRFPGQHVFGDPLIHADVGNRLDQSGQVFQRAVLVVVGQFDQPAFLECVEERFHA